jgi:hypothetical protein
MTKSCTGCGESYTAARRNQRFCTRRCRQASYQRLQPIRDRDRAPRDRRAASLRILALAGSGA